MNANARQARATIRQRNASTRAGRRIARNGEASLTTHALAAGLPIRAARTVASSLRSNAAKLGITGRTITVRRHGARRDCALYTVAAVAQAAAAYRPRKPQYKTARQHMLAA